MGELLNEYIVQQALIVIPVLMFLGLLLKETPNMKDWLIPYLLLILGVCFTTMLMGFSTNSVIQGVLVSGAAVFGHQIFKQTLKKDNDD